MARGAWDKVAPVLWLMTNQNRDVKQHPTPFPLDEFNPFRKSDSDTDSGPDMAAIAQIKRSYKVTRLSNGKVDRSREGISPTADR